MRFSLYINPQTRGPEDDAQVIGAVTEQAIEADQSGFVAIYLTEHHFTGYNAYSDPLMLGAYLAPQIERARLGFSVAVPPLHHPLKFAEQCNLLDVFTGGRAIIGVGTGGGPLEFAGFGLDPKDRHSLTDRAMEVVIQAWTHQVGDPPLEYATPFGRGRLEGRVIPASIRKPYPLIARACVSDESVIKTAQHGWPLITGRFGPERTARQWALYRETLHAAGHGAEISQECLELTAMLKMMYIAETDEQAQRDLAEPIEDFLLSAYIANSADTLEAEYSRLDGPIRISAASREKRADFLDRALISGSPDTVAAEIHRFADVGITHMMLWFTWGHNHPAKVRRSLRLFVDEVMPRFTPARAAVSPS